MLPFYFLTSLPVGIPLSLIEVHYSPVVQHNFFLAFSFRSCTSLFLALVKIVDILSNDVSLICSFRFMPSPESIVSFNWSDGNSFWTIDAKGNEFESKIPDNFESSMIFDFRQGECVEDIEADKIDIQTMKYRADNGYLLDVSFV
ncbi:hypothetical protein HK096_010007, partial [Nowakowskiella sp. JEL0078]